jgi:hypothetical protein
MPSRIVLGNRGADTGLWISKPGKDALTATAEEDYLVNNSRLNTQPVMKGILQNPTVYYQGTTRSTGSTGVYVCDEYGSNIYNCSENYSAGKQWAYWYTRWYDGRQIYGWCNVDYYCKRGHWEYQQVDNPGVATYSATIPHNLGYLPQCILSATTEYPGNPCPNIFIDANNIYLRYYEADVGYTAGGIVWTAGKPGAMTMFCDIHYTLFAQEA